MNITLLDNTDSYNVSIVFNSLVLTNVDFITNTITINSQTNTESYSLINSIVSINDSPLTVLSVVL